MIAPVRASVLCVAAGALAGVSCARPVAHTYEQSYWAADYNWAFREHFPQADRLFNGFDYGHAVLYETLLTRGDAARRLESREFPFITTSVLPHPPSVPLEEAAIGPEYVKLVPEVAAMFDWAHAFHRQLYDIWGGYGLTWWQRDSAVAQALRYYSSRKDLAFSTRPKSMELMEGQPYSLAFRRQDPKFNGLLWSYHWLQMSLYDALIEGRSERQMQAAVDAKVATFFRMLDSAPAHMPGEMPMSPGSAPIFSARYPTAAIVFDNLHSLHDVVSDILASNTVPASGKRAAILAAAAAYRDDTTGVISVDEWREMGRMMAPHLP
jgi:hypothetical protein